MATRPAPINEFFKDPPLLWQVVQNRHGQKYLGEAHCPSCKVRVDMDGNCLDPACGKQYRLVSQSFDEARNLAGIRYEAAQKQGHLVVVARGPKQAEDKAETDTHFLNAVLEKKDGRLQGVVTMGERTADQGSRDKVQLFIDFRSKEIRHDHTNASPDQLVSGLKAVFEEGSSQVIKYGSDSDNPPTLKIELLDDVHDGWANWGGPGQGSGFRFHLGIDNFQGEVDFVSDIKVKANDALENSWATTHFKFDQLEPKAKLKIEAGIMTDAWVFLTDEPGQTQRLLPDIDHDNVNIAITLRSTGEDVNLPIKPNHLKHA